MSLHYQHSGTAPLFGIAFATIVGLIAAILGGFVYSYAAVYIPFVYINFALTAGYGALIGGAVAWQSRRGHIRSRLIPALIGSLCGNVGLYVAWGADLLARLGWDAVPSPEMAFDPEQLKMYISIFYEKGFWSIGKNGGNVSGGFLAFVWFAEWATIVGLATILPWSTIADLAYCEDCNCWCESRSDLQRLDLTDADMLADRVNQGELKALATTYRTQNPGDFLRIDLLSCPSCGESHFLNLVQVNTTTDKNGETKVATKTLVDKLVVGKTEVETVLNAGVEPPSPPPIPNPSSPDGSDPLNLAT